MKYEIEGPPHLFDGDFSWWYLVVKPEGGMAALAPTEAMALRIAALLNLDEKKNQQQEQEKP